MLASVFELNLRITATAGILIAFFATVLLLWKCKDKLPRDMGRDFAVDGKLSAGKPRGAGFLFVLIFASCALLFAPIEVEWIIYLLLVAASMLTGFLDDCSKNPWGEYKKAVLDLIIAIMVAVTYINYHGTTVAFLVTETTLTLPVPLFGLLVVVLVWASINVTNCADGVDGLSGTLTLITLGTFYILDKQLNVQGDFAFFILMFMSCILGYLWYNATPSRLMMGDAGSRAMGIFISIAALKSGSPFLYIPVALVLILDGGLGLVKVSLIRVCKIHIMKNIRTPLHDHVRKVKSWSNTQTVFRFAIIQIVLAAAVIYGIR